MEIQTFLSLNIWYIFYVTLCLKYVFMSFVIHCILFFFTFYSDPVHSDPVTFSIPEGCMMNALTANWACLSCHCFWKFPQT